MQFYNTMTRRKEPFTPVRPGKVGLYACGITAYALSHIGHARSAVAFDVLVRLLRFKGYEVTFVRTLRTWTTKSSTGPMRKGDPAKRWPPPTSRRFMKIWIGSGCAGLMWNPGPLNISPT